MDLKDLTFQELQDKLQEERVADPACASTCREPDREPGGPQPQAQGRGPVLTELRARELNANNAQ